MNKMDRFGAASIGLALVTMWCGCGGATTTPAVGALPPPAAPSTGVVSMQAPPPATPAPSSPAPETTPPPATIAPSEQPAAELSEAQRHRHRHHAGVLGLLVLSLKDLDLSTDQRATIDKVRDRMKEALRPARQAGQALANALADGVAAGGVDEGKTDAAINDLVNQVTAVHPASMAALDELHRALNQKQRAELMGAVRAHWEMWKEAQGRDEVEGYEGHPGHLSALTQELGLSGEQAKQIRANFQTEMNKARQEHSHQEVEDHLRAFAAAFEADRFDAKKLKDLTGSSHMARWGATRMVHFVEASLSVLTTEQRSKLAQRLRDRAARDD